MFIRGLTFRFSSARCGEQVSAILPSKTHTSRVDVITWIGQAEKVEGVSENEVILTLRGAVQIMVVIFGKIAWKSRDANEFLVALVK